MRPRRRGRREQCPKPVAEPLSSCPYAPSTPGCSPPPLPLLLLLLLLLLFGDAPEFRGLKALKPVPLISAADRPFGFSCGCRIQDSGSRNNPSEWHVTLPFGNTAGCIFSFLAGLYSERVESGHCALGSKHEEKKKQHESRRKTT